MIFPISSVAVILVGASISQFIAITPQVIRPIANGSVDWNRDMKVHSGGDVGVVGYGKFVVSPNPVEGPFAVAWLDDQVVNLHPPVSGALTSYAFGIDSDGTYQVGAGRLHYPISDPYQTNFSSISRGYWPEDSPDFG